MNNIQIDPTYKTQRTAYAILLILIIIASGWYTIPRLIDRFYNPAPSQEEIDAFRAKIEGAERNKTMEDYLLEVEKNNPAISPTVMNKQTEKLLQGNKKNSYSETEKQNILNSLNNK